MFGETESASWSIPIVAAFASGLFALLGAFAGGALSRRTEYEKWVRANRSDAFAKFLELMAQAQHNAINHYRDPGLVARLEADIRVTEEFARPLSYARVVALYLPKSQREQFRTLAKDAVVIQTQRSIGDGRITLSDSKVEEIAQLFASSLD